jgi:hypothetical protein
VQRVARDRLRWQLQHGGALTGIRVSMEIRASTSEEAERAMHRFTTLNSGRRVQESGSGYKDQIILLRQALATSEAALVVSEATRKALSEENQELRRQLAQ